MFQSIMNTLFSCSHPRTTFPLTPVRRGAATGGGSRTYVVCLDCGREFDYNWQDMRVGEPVATQLPAPEAQPSFR